MEKVNDEDTLNWYIQGMRKFWGMFEPNLCDVIAEARGWLPLKRKESMVIHYDDKEYIITRVK